MLRQSQRQYREENPDVWRACRIARYRDGGKGFPVSRIAPSSASVRPACGRILALLMVLPFVLLSLMAQGTMVAAGPTPQSFMVVLCADHLPVEMVLDDDGSVITADEYRARQDAPVPKTPKPPCDWSAHAQPVLETAPTVQSARLDAPRPAEPAPAHDLRILRAQVLAPSARGPPAV